jgi:hypothetical protein
MVMTALYAGMVMIEFLNWVGWDSLMIALRDTTGRAA